MTSQQPLMSSQPIQAELRQFSVEAWKIASRYSGVLASETRDLAGQIDDSHASLKARLEQAERAVDVLESNADTGRRAEEQDDMLAAAADFLNYSRSMDAMDLGAKITAYRLAQQKAAAKPAGETDHG